MEASESVKQICEMAALRVALKNNVCVSKVICIRGFGPYGPYGLYGIYGPSGW